MNLMLNMKDIKKILAKTHFKYKKKVKKPTCLEKTCFVFFIFKSAGEGEGGLRVTLLD
jgi:hypothetical protein